MWMTLKKNALSLTCPQLLMHVHCTRQILVYYKFKTSSKSYSKVVTVNVSFECLTWNILNV